MQRRLAVVASAALLAAGAGSAVLLAQAAEASGPHKARDESSTRQFVGYWMGIDPLDGGDSRRGITVNNNRTFSVIGRDTVFTLCDSTDRAIITRRRCQNHCLGVGERQPGDQLHQQQLDCEAQGPLRRHRQEHPSRDGDDSKW